jgi:DNA modification methylase
MTVRILIGDVRDRLRDLNADSIDCVITSPPYWGLRDYGVDGQLGMESTLGEHIETLVDVFREIRRVVKPQAAVWLNYGDCYATSPNGRSAADTKATGNDDRTFRDKPFSTIGPIYDPNHRARGARGNNLDHHAQADAPTGRVVAGGYLKPKDLCLVPFRLVIALQEDGWWVRSRCIWGKPNGMPDSSGRYRPSTAHEEVFLLSKSGDIWYDFEAVKAPASGDSHGAPLPNPGPKQVTLGQSKGATTLGVRRDKQRGHSRHHQGFNDRWDGMSKAEQQENGRLLRTYEPEVWHIATAAYQEAHFATFPPALVERCLMASLPRGGTVLDPFGGSGTVGMVADGMGHHAILIELNEAYAEIARKRISDVFRPVWIERKETPSQPPLPLNTP